jgi:hypothetical protein
MGRTLDQMMEALAHTEAALRATGDHGELLRERAEFCWSG